MSDSSHPFNRPEFTHKKSSSKKPLIIAAAIVVVLLASGAVWWFMNRGEASTDSTVSTSSEDAPTASNVQQLADKEVYGPNKSVEKGLALYDEVIESASDEQKTALYTEKSFLAVNNGDADAALDAALNAIKADKEQKDYSSHFAAATAYERLGNKADAIKQYELALENYLKVSNAPDSGTAVFYKKQIAGLKA